MMAKAEVIKTAVSPTLANSSAHEIGMLECQAYQFGTLPEVEEDIQHEQDI